MEQSEKDKTSRIAEIRLLSDLPLAGDKEQEMRFGHPSIVENLRHMVLTCPTPFTIGLFAKWGTGKTTILDAVRRRFHGTDVATVKIDAWKHESDALRRTFLRDTVSQLQESQDGKQYLNPKERLSENWQSPVSRTFQGGFRFEGKIKRAFIYFSAALLIGGGLILGLWRQAFGIYLSIIFGGGLTSGVILWLLQKAITTETITATTDRFEDPQEFEAEFSRIIKLVEAEKILIIVDNLDRVSCEKAVELLATIKTFMELPRCVFLIACDAEAIKRHLERVYSQDAELIGSNSRFDGDEFLRKFFNGYLNIPPFIDTELQDYTEYLLRETNLNPPDFSDVAFVITLAFRDNPRQIKQFINTLIAHYILAEARETENELPPKSVTGHVAYLAKHLIIGQQYSEDYVSYLESNGSITEVSGNPELTNFLVATQPIHVDDIRPFIYLKLSQDEIDMPEIKDLRLAMQANDVKAVQQIIKTYEGDTVKRSKFNRFAFSDVVKNKGRGLILFNIVNSILVALQQVGFKLEKHFYQQVAKLLGDDTQLGTRLSHFDPALIFSQVFDQCSWELKTNLIDKYVELFHNPEHISNPYIERDTFTQMMTQHFLEHTDLLSENQKTALRKAFEEKHFSYRMLSMFANRKAEREVFLSEPVISKYVDSLSPNDVESPENLKLKTQLLFDFEEIITEGNLVEITSKLGELVEQDTAKPYREEKVNLVNCIDNFHNYFGNRLGNIPQENKNEFATKIFNSINALQNWQEKGIFIPVCIWLTGILEDPVKSQIESIINSFFSDANIDGLKTLFTKMKTKSVKEEIIAKYESIFRQRSLADDAVFNELYPLASKEIRTQWLEGLIQSDHEKAIGKLEDLKFKIDDRKSIVSALLNKADQLPVEQREKLYSTCNSLNCANDVTLKEKLASNIKTYLRNTAPNIQTIGLNILKGAAHLSATQKRDIATDTIDWLSSLQPDTAYQPSSIQSVLEILKILPWTPRQKFLDFVFDRLMKRGINVQNIDFGFNILNGYEPKIQYEQYSTYFDDIWSRTESETDNQTKTALIDGLKRLMPTRTNSNNRTYWEKVKGIGVPNTTPENE